MLGKIEGKRRRWQQRMRWLDSITDSVDMNLSKLGEDSGGQRSLVCCSPWGRKESDTTEWRKTRTTWWEEEGCTCSLWCISLHLWGNRHGEEKRLVQGHVASEWDKTQVFGCQSWSFASDLTLSIISLLWVLACMAVSHLMVVQPSEFVSPPLSDSPTWLGLYKTP